MWLAKNKSGNLCLFNTKPLRCEDFWYEDCKDDNELYINPIFTDVSLFKKLTWEDEPIEVELVTKQLVQVFGDNCYTCGLIDACHDEYGEDTEGYPLFEVFKKDYNK